MDWVMDRPVWQLVTVGLVAWAMAATAAWTLARAAAAPAPRPPARHGSPSNVRRLPATKPYDQDTDDRATR